MLASALALRKIEHYDHGEVSALIGLLTNKDSEIITAAIWTLGEFGEDAGEAVPPLRKILETAHPETAALVVRTLGLIGPAARPAIPRRIRRQLHGLPGL